MPDTYGALRQQGSYAAGQKQGEWVYYSTPGVLAQRYDHSTGQLLYWRSPDGREQAGPEAARNHPALYLGGSGGLLHNMLTAELIEKIPPQLGTDSIDVTVAISGAGAVDSVFLPQRPTGKPSTLQRAAVQAIRNAPADWASARKTDQAVPGLYRLRLVTTFTRIGNSSRRSAELRQLD
ncbi:hypothetical protein [Hymenobacter sp. CRA2]|uniref:hypothetical protein n=1 Tax=Hymenobacter sp. CRA2 TaxID=1955620 RepID=UPI00098EC032|nr:hypothetical protein [Hymenobacter sp. CRA2]OON70482.1 hypothetical protein B0919_00150 [Hymenobacter sp. CRA2]